MQSVLLTLTLKLWSIRTQSVTYTCTRTGDGLAQRYHEDTEYNKYDSWCLRHYDVLGYYFNFKNEHVNDFTATQMKQLTVKIVNIQVNT